MKFEELFDNRSVFADKLKICIRDAGYTKVSFSKKAEISRPTLDRILNGELDNKSTFDKHVQKIFKVLKISLDDVMYHTETPVPVQAVYSANEPEDYVMSDKEKRQHELLQDILDICAIYY